MSLRCHPSSLDPNLISARKSNFDFFCNFVTALFSVYRSVVYSGECQRSGKRDIFPFFLSIRHSVADRFTGITYTPFIRGSIHEAHLEHNLRANLKQT